MPVSFGAAVMLVVVVQKANEATVDIIGGV
jgi:hypothetical protein